MRAVPNHRLAHTVLPYASVDELVAGALPFLRQGLSNGDQTLVVSGTANLRLLRRALGPDARAVEFIDALGWYQHPARTLATYDRYIKEQVEHGRRVWVVGELVWADRSALETTEWQRYESLVNVAFARSGACILCAYDKAALDPSIMTAAMRTHPWVQTGGQTRGSADFMDPAAFSAACDAHPLPEPPPSTIAVEFSSMLDLGAVRRLVADWAVAAGLDRHRIPEAALAVHEIASNVLVHGSGRGRLLVWLTGRTLLYQVSGDDPIRLSFPGHLPPAVDSEHGRGLWLARQLCELLEVRSTPDGSVFRLHFPLPG